MIFLLGLMITSSPPNSEVWEFSKYTKDCSREQNFPKDGDIQTSKNNHDKLRQWNKKEKIILMSLKIFNAVSKYSLLRQFSRTGQISQERGLSKSTIYIILK